MRTATVMASPRSSLALYKRRQIPTLVVGSPSSGTGTFGGNVNLPSMTKRGSWSSAIPTCLRSEAREGAGIAT